jgi:hypothetical protein
MIDQQEKREKVYKECDTAKGHTGDTKIGEFACTSATKKGDF